MLFLNAKNCWQQIHKPTIVQHNDRDLSKKSGFPFPSGFRDFEKTNQTEQTVNRKKSGFRTARFLTRQQRMCYVFSLTLQHVKLW